MKSAFRLWVLLICFAAGTAGAAFAQEEKEPGAAEDAEHAEILKKLDLVLEELKAVKEEVAIVKVRASQR